LSLFQYNSQNTLLIIPEKIHYLNIKNVHYFYKPERNIGSGCRCF